MKNIIFLLILSLGLSLRAAEIKDPIQDIRGSYQSIKASFNPEQNQFLGIIKNKKVNTYLKDTPLAFWINTISTANTRSIKMKSKRTTYFPCEYTVLDTVTIDITDLDFPFEKGKLTMHYDDDVRCENIEALLCYSDTTICMGAMYLSYNDNNMIDTMTVKMINEDGGLSTAGKIVANYNSNDYITKLNISLCYEKLDLIFENAIAFEIAYDESDQLAQVNLFANSDFTTYVSYNMISNDDSITFAEERLSLGEVAISRNTNNDIVCMYAKYNNILDTAWQGVKYDITYQDTLITEYKLSDLSKNGWVDSTAQIMRYTYNDHNNLIKYTNSYYDSDTESRDYDDFTKLFYNEKQQIDSIYRYNLENISNDNDEAGELSGKYIYEYDCNGNLFATTRSYKSQNTWKDSKRYEYRYDTNNLLTSLSKYYSSSKIDSFLEYREKYTFEYNTDNRLSTYTTIKGNVEYYSNNYNIIDSVSQSWDNIKRYKLTWDDEFMQALQYERYNDTCWQKREKIELTHDSFENFTGGQYYTMQDEEPEWTLFGSLNIDYNTEIELGDMEIPELASRVINHAVRSMRLNPNLTNSTCPYDDLPINTELLGYTNIDDALNGLLTNFQVNNAPSKISLSLNQEEESIGGSIDFHYSKMTKNQVTSNEYNKASQDLLLYPNPAANNVSIAGAKDGDLINIYDVNGKQVFQKSILQNNTVDISSLLKGLYLYSVSSGDQETKGKLVVK